MFSRTYEPQFHDNAKAPVENHPNFTHEVQTIGPVKGRFILDKCLYEKQRKARDWHSKEYTTAMRKGGWHPYSVLKLCVVRIDGEDHFFLIDGQHRMHAVIDSHTEQVFTVLTERVGTMEEVAARYAATDNGLPRSIEDLMTPLGIEEKTGLTASQQKTVRACASSIMLFKFNRNHGPMGQTYEARSPIEHAKRIIEWATPAKIYFDAIGNNVHRANRGVGGIAPFLLASPVAAVGIVTCNHQPEKARLFWNTIASGEEIKRGTPEYVLRDFITFSRPAKIGHEIYVRRVASCWNRYYHNDSMSRFGAVDVGVPVVIDGTPYK